MPDDETKMVTPEHLEELRKLGASVALSHSSLKLIQRRIGVLEARAEENDIALEAISGSSRKIRQELAELRAQIALEQKETP